MSYSRPPSLVAGFDPGLRHTGWGIVVSDKHQLSYIASGTISPNPKLPLEQRLSHIKHHIAQTIQLHQPHECAIEKMFVGKSSESALLLAHARGVILCELSSLGFNLQEYHPKTVKRAITQNGNASKEQVAFMIKHLLPKAQASSPDEADALAVAICHAHHLTSPQYNLQSLNSS